MCSINFSYYTFMTKPFYMPHKINNMIYNSALSLICLFVVLGPNREFFTRMVTSPLSAKGFFWPILCTQNVKYTDRRTDVHVQSNLYLYNINFTESGKLFVQACDFVARILFLTFYDNKLLILSWISCICKFLTTEIPSTRSHFVCHTLTTIMLSDQTI